MKKILLLLCCSICFLDCISQHSVTKTKKVSFIPEKDNVDINIPKSGVTQDDVYVLIIANEDYQYVEDVSYAVRDGVVFKEYCEKTLGIEKNKIKLLTNQSAATIDAALEETKHLPGIYKKLIFYYSGHGVHDEETNSYLLPIDCAASNLKHAIKLADLYNNFSNSAWENVFVFLDACFSGTTKGGEMLEKNARAVKVKVKDGVVKGNLVVFSATSSDQSAYPSDDYRHGVFTYYLLKKLKETKGDVSLYELNEYVKHNVKKYVFESKNKWQEPKMSASSKLKEQLQTIKLK